LLEGDQSRAPPDSQDRRKIRAIIQTKPDINLYAFICHQICDEGRVKVLETIGIDDTVRLLSAITAIARCKVMKENGA
jgi:hypothetical protein